MFESDAQTNGPKTRPDRQPRPKHGRLGDQGTSGGFHVQLLITPTWPTRAEGSKTIKETCRDWALTNVYEMEVTYPSGERSVAQFDPSGNPHKEGAFLLKEERPQLVTTCKRSATF